MIAKICGVTKPSDARWIEQAGADFIGLNLMAGPRAIDTGRAAAIVEALDDPARAVPLLGAQPNDEQPNQEPANRERPDPIWANMGVRLIQWYGAISCEIVRHWGASGLQLVPVLRGGPGFGPADFDQPCAAGCGTVLIDAPTDRVRRDGAPARRRPQSVEQEALGGTGRAADWQAIAGARDAARLAGLSLWLAGGLRPDNVSEAIRIVGPDGVDVSSGVEAAPGIKDRAKVEAFLAAVRGA